MYPTTETDERLYVTDSFAVEIVEPGESFDDPSFDDMSEADQQFLSEQSAELQKHQMLRKEFAQQHLRNVLKQGEKCQCSSCKSFAQDLLENFTRTWGD